MKHPKPTKKKYDKQAFQEKILKLDPVCMAPGCDKPSDVGHHVIYKSKWSTPIENAVGFDRDDIRNGIGLCSTCHRKAHDGLGINGISGREWVFRTLNNIIANAGSWDDVNHMFYRFIEVRNQIYMSLVRKGILN